MTYSNIFDTIELDAYPKKMKKPLIVTEDLLRNLVKGRSKDKFFFKDLTEKPKRYIIPIFTTDNFSFGTPSVQQYDIIILQINTLSMFFDSIIFGVIPDKGGNSLEIYTSHDEIDTAGALASYLGFNRFYDRLQKRQVDCVGEYKTLGADIRIYWDKEDPKKELSNSNPPTDETNRPDSPGQHESASGAEETKRRGVRE